jgi:putative endonuclease
MAPSTLASPALSSSVSPIIVRAACPGLTKRYGCRLLVHYEVYDLITDAIQRETRLKRWPRKWKLALIETHNPQGRDLADDLTM